MTTKLVSAVGSADGDTERNERPLDAWRVPVSEQGERFVQEIIRCVEYYECETGLRKRKRKPNDEMSFRQAITAVASDLAVYAIAAESHGIYLSLSHRKPAQKSRYRDPTATRKMSALLKMLSSPQLDLIKIDIGYETAKGKNRATVIRPSVAMMQLIAKYGLSLKDFGEVERTEPIELKTGKENYRDRGRRVDFEETARTLKLREQMQGINSYLAAANIRHVGPKAVDTNKRQMRRVFTCDSFESGGRLFGGFWQTMKKEERLRHLRINGEPVVELDFGQVMPRLMYAHAGVIPGMNDLYAIKGLGDQDRKGIKKVMSSMQFVMSPLKRFPKGTRKYFSEDVKVQDVTEAIMKTHPGIAHLFHTGIGHHCQYLESCILVEVLRILNSFTITALPIHDAIIVPVSAVEKAKRVMLHTFEVKTGQKGTVDVLTLQRLEENLQPQLPLVA